MKQNDHERFNPFCATTFNTGDCVVCFIACYYFVRKYTPFADDFFRFFRARTNDFVEKSSSIKTNALKYIEMNNYDTIICGHTHLPEHTEKYVNTGSFCEKECSYVVIDKKDKISLTKIK